MNYLLSIENSGTREKFYHHSIPGSTAHSNSEGPGHGEAPLTDTDEDKDAFCDDTSLVSPRADPIQLITGFNHLVSCSVLACTSNTDSPCPHEALTRNQGNGTAKILSISLAESIKTRPREPPPVRLTRRTQVCPWALPMLTNIPSMLDNATSIRHLELDLAVREDPYFRAGVLNIAHHSFPFLLLPHRLKDWIAKMLISTGYPEIVATCGSNRRHWMHLVATEGIYRLTFGPLQYATIFPNIGKARFDTIMTVSIHIVRTQSVNIPPSDVISSNIRPFGGSSVIRRRCEITIVGMPSETWSLPETLVRDIKTLISFKRLIFNLRCLSPDTDLTAGRLDWETHSIPSSWHHLQAAGAQLYEAIGPFTIQSEGAIFHPQDYAIQRQIAVRPPMAGIANLNRLSSYIPIPGMTAQTRPLLTIRRFGNVPPMYVAAAIPPAGVRQAAPALAAAAATTIPVLAPVSQDVLAPRTKSAQFSPVPPETTLVPRQNPTGLQKALPPPPLLPQSPKSNRVPTTNCPSHSPKPPKRTHPAPRTNPTPNPNPNPNTAKTTTIRTGTTSTTSRPGIAKQRSKHPRSSISIQSVEPMSKRLCATSRYPRLGEDLG